MNQSATWKSSDTPVRSDLPSVILRIVENGILTGMLGAAVVAVWFLVLDLITRGTPFFTPSLLGSILFAGRDVSEITDVNGAAIFAYTGLHGLLFLGAGMMLAWMFHQFESNPQVGIILLLLFVTFEAIVWSVGVSMIPQLAGAVGAWAIMVANAASAVTMFAYLIGRHPLAVTRLREAFDE